MLRLGCFWCAPSISGKDAKYICGVDALLEFPPPQVDADVFLSSRFLANPAGVIAIVPTNNPRSRKYSTGLLGCVPIETLDGTVVGELPGGSMAMPTAIQ
jgi:hypothetical protein